MKKLIFALLALTVMATAAFAAVYSQNFVLINDTGDTIAKIYLSPTRASSWREEDELESDTAVLRDGESLTITFEPWVDTRYWDIRAEFTDGSTIDWYEFDLFSVVSVTLERNGTATYELAQ